MHGKVGRKRPSQSTQRKGQIGTKRAGWAQDWAHKQKTDRQNARLILHFRLAPWASRRRRDLLELLDRLNPTIAELIQAIEQEAEKCPPAVLRGLAPSNGGWLLGDGDFSPIDKTARPVVTFIPL
jgi:hypothetical protein